MDNPMTPRLVEIVQKTRAVCELDHSNVALVYKSWLLEMANEIERLSRLMAEGGLTKEPLQPSASLEEKEAQMRTVLAGEIEKRGYSAFDLRTGAEITPMEEVALAAMKAWGLLQAVERVTVPREATPAIKAAITVSAWRSGSGVDPATVWRAALEAAEPHP